MFTRASVKSSSARLNTQPQPSQATTLHGGICPRHNPGGGEIFFSAWEWALVHPRAFDRHVALTPHKNQIWHHWMNLLAKLKGLLATGLSRKAWKTQGICHFHDI